MGIPLAYLQLTFSYVNFGGGLHSLYRVCMAKTNAVARTGFQGGGDHTVLCKLDLLINKLCVVDESRRGYTRRVVVEFLPGNVSKHIFQSENIL